MAAILFQRTVLSQPLTPRRKGTLFRLLAQNRHRMNSSRLNMAPGHQDHAILHSRRRERPCPYR